MSDPSAKKPVRQAVSSETLNRIFSALAHPARRLILVALHARGGVMTAGEIADRFKHSWPTTTRHLGVLELAGLLEVQKQGRRRVYRLKPEVAMQAADWIQGWAAVEVEESAAKPFSSDASYATMRNAIPPEND